MSPLGLKQLPTSWPVVMSTTAGLPAMPANVVPAGKVTKNSLLASPVSPPVPESVNRRCSSCALRRRAVGDVLSPDAVRLPAAATVKGGETAGAASPVVCTETVWLCPASGFVTPRNGIEMRRPAGSVTPVSTRQMILPPLGLWQNPMSLPFVVSITRVLVRYPPNAVPAGNVTSIWPLLVSAFVSVKATTYCVRAPAAVVGTVLSTVTSVAAKAGEARARTRTAWRATGAHADPNRSGSCRGCGEPPMW